MCGERGVCMAKGGVCAKGLCLAREACVVERWTYMAGAHAWQGVRAFYWNGFLFLDKKNYALLYGANFV